MYEYITKYKHYKKLYINLLNQIGGADKDSNTKIDVINDYLNINPNYALSEGERYVLQLIKNNQMLNEQQIFIINNLYKKILPTHATLKPIVIPTIQSPLPSKRPELKRESRFHITDTDKLQAREKEFTFLNIAHEFGKDIVINILTETKCLYIDLKDYVQNNIFYINPTNPNKEYSNVQFELMMNDIIKQYDITTKIKENINNLQKI